MEMMRLRPFGQRRKTYFYGVAGFVLAAHVVVGAIIHVMPPDLTEGEGEVALGEINIVEIAPVIETGAVIMIEEATATTTEPATEEVEVQPAPPEFSEVGGSDPIAPELDPLGPTEASLPPVLIEEPVEPAVNEDPVVVVPKDPQPEPEVKQVPKTTTPKAPPITKTQRPPKTQPKQVTKKNTAPKPKPQELVKKPVPEPEPQRAVPVAPPSHKRTGLLERRRQRTQAAAQPKSNTYVAATWKQRPPPYYPYEQRKQGIEGTAHVRVSIDASGRIVASKLVKSTGNKQLDQAALISVTKGVLSPARRGDRAVTSEMLVPFEFYLP